MHATWGVNDQVGWWILETRWMALTFTMAKLKLYKHEWVFGVENYSFGT